MADDDWKKRVGININFSPDSSEDEGRTFTEGEKDDQYPEQSPSVNIESYEGSFDAFGNQEDDILNDYDQYSTTPPRTRISRRLKERKQRVREEACDTKNSSSSFNSKLRRRNTLDAVLFCQLLEKCEDGQSPNQEYDVSQKYEGGKRSKRSMKLLRGSERDMKLDHTEIGLAAAPAGEMSEDRAESMPVALPQPAIKVESCNRFLSLTSKLVACSKFMQKDDKPRADYPQNRVEFYNTFSLLIRMGNSEKQTDKNPRRQLSKEEHLWQNELKDELKDLIWLELQAWHADRTPTEQDKYLCHAREGVQQLLDDIMNYRFQKKASKLPNKMSTQASDSGVSSDGTDNTSQPKSDVQVCTGCLSVFCKVCTENQNAALKEVEELLNRLEVAESLYPSCKAVGVQYPLYKSSEFVGRVKAMCLWYNMTKHQRLVLIILGKLLLRLESKGINWPHVGEDDNTSGIATDTSTSEEPSTSQEQNTRSTSPPRKVIPKNKNRIQFDVETSSPSDSNNSNISSHGSTNSCDEEENVMEYYSSSINKSYPATHSKKPSPINPYRKYIEDMLKTKGLRKSLNFVEKLHRHILIKSKATLCKPVERDKEHEVESQDKGAESSSTLVNPPNSCPFKGTSFELPEHEQEELSRYGYWSAEARSLHLPSYRSAFLFLSRIPLEIIHEFLRMRLEQKPENPSALCIRQLMREMKEGIRIAVLHRQRYLSLVHAVLWDCEKDIIEGFEEGVKEFDRSVKMVLELYLEYLQKWVPMVQHEQFQKNLLEEEWLFIKKMCPYIPCGEGAASTSFCRIARGMLEAVGEYLTTRVKELTKIIHNGDESDEDISVKQTALSVCREIQFLYTEARDRALKALAFAKTLRKDLENPEFLSSIHPSCSVIIAGSLQELKARAVSLCSDITTTIRLVEDTCDAHDMTDLEECDRLQVLNRSREVLHFGYKFGFEYHKEVCRLVTGEVRTELSHGLICFAQQWMKFVRERCERGRGLRPRWANQGLDFLMTVCEPENTQYLSDNDFDDLKRSIDGCISHVIGTAVTNNEKCSLNQQHNPLYGHLPRASFDGQFPRSRGSSPARTKSPSYRSSRSLQDTSVTPPFPHAQRSISACVSAPVDETDTVNSKTAVTVNIPSGVPRIRRVYDAVRKLERDMDEKLRNKELIGSVSDVEYEDKIHIKARSVTFSWQRGIKIGQGRFGKVYTAVNNQTGELMAMKEIQLQPNDHRTIRRVAEELRIFEGIQHPGLVRYYGVEIHIDEMLIFMEFCAEGTLESLVAATENGLPEGLIRRYTYQLLQAVKTLHDHGIVHRDIKSANIFLTGGGNHLKLGDFGSAVKIKAHTTMPGELQGFVGTQAYMAPEVFTKTDTGGHGRAADIWSLGCVVVEMASGKRPWPEYDSNYQIMYKVGMGETPSAPPTLSEEGHKFVDRCLQHDPRRRATAKELLYHTFVRVDLDEEYLSSTLPSMFEDYLKINPRIL
ncbi:mitogen-activated protein kinase kinase kinase 4 isoform X1 [Schistocerca serialis cubense]|uniref:mitogen-activated protein kinase kinase kinase 4 isoform X1 n=1 Tax=Schistocerca serialis cubense TaxID=2023355 RepID=UPI00214F3F5B|nr:mitogen-activated protein kinase kinase kinase 4 isoform X1 [Schistocerca serialis cubense]